MTENPVVPLYLALGLIILAARLAGGLARRFNQPRVLGELIVGIILGPTLLDMLHSTLLGLEQAHLERTVHELAELGVLLLMFKIGLDVHLRELLKVGKVAVLAGVLGALLPVALTVPVVMLFNYSWAAALFAGVTLAATSVSISAQVLLELGVMQSRDGNALLATALMDDVVAILLVSFSMAISGPESGAGAGGLLLIVLQMAAFIGIAFAIAWFALPRLITWMHEQPSVASTYGVPAFALVLALLFGWAAETLGGVAAITGAFIAGVGLSRARMDVKRPIDAAVANMAYAFLVPIFFVSVGLNVDLHAITLEALPLAGALLLVAVVSKVIGGGLGAQMGGFDRSGALRLGVCMISRGEVGLIIASVGLAQGVFRPGDPLFAALFLVILLTTVLTPPLVRLVFQRTGLVTAMARG